MGDREYQTDDAYLHFDEMCWPDPNDPADVVSRLIWDDEDTAVRRVAVSYVGAFQRLVWMPQRQRNEVIAALRREAALKPRRDDS